MEILFGYPVILVICLHGHRINYEKGAKTTRRSRMDEAMGEVLPRKQDWKVRQREKYKYKYKYKCLYK